MTRRGLPYTGIEQVQASVLQIFDVLGQGVVSAEVLRDRARCLGGRKGESLLALIDLASMLEKRAERRRRPMPAVTNPGYRKGTSNQPTTWSNCLWQPPGHCS